jgi:hypothetical protein
MAGLATGSGRNSQATTNMAVAKTTHCMTEVMGAMLSLSPGAFTRSPGGIDRARAFKTTSVVAGLKAEPVILLDGGPRGVRALNNATLIAIHRVSMKSSLPLMLSVLSDRGIMRGEFPSGTEDRL